MWRVAILSGIGLVLSLGVVGILVGVLVDGAATLDDVGLPAAFVLVLVPIAIGGLAYGIHGIRALGRHELLLALDAAPPAITRVEPIVDGYGTSLRFHLPSGASYTIWMAPQPQLTNEIVAWLAPRA